MHKIMGLYFLLLSYSESCAKYLKYIYLFFFFCGFEPTLLCIRLMNFLPVLELMLLMLMRRTSLLDLQLVMMICGQRHF